MDKTLADRLRDVLHGIGTSASKDGRWMEAAEATLLDAINAVENVASVTIARLDPNATTVSDGYGGSVTVGMVPRWYEPHQTSDTCDCP